MIMPVWIKSVYIGKITGGIVNFGDVCYISPFTNSKENSEPPITGDEPADNSQSAERLPQRKKTFKQR
ncbi:spore germination protein [Priestia flexa]